MTREVLKYNIEIQLDFLLDGKPLSEVQDYILQCSDKYAELLAKERAEEFAEWIRDYDNFLIKLENDRWYQSCGNSITWSTEQLYQLYLAHLSTIKNDV